MSNGSPTAFLTWAILASLFFAFLLYHLWSYDRLQCLKWNAGRQPGAFRRLMTYSYLGSTPLFIIFGVGITTLKFKEGFVTLSQNEVYPKPTDLWTKGHRNMLLGLLFVFSVAWALEQITHFEELAFWFFLLDQGPKKRDWFRSLEYRLWSIACFVSILGMPLTALLSRHDILTTDAWIFLVGSLGSTTTNVLFIFILIRFPSFFRHVKAEGADPDVVVRLATFNELNLVRIVFRFATVGPLLILAVDGIRGSHIINRSLFWTDILLIISAIGQFVSGLITIVIFFPRSLTNENGYRNRIASPITEMQTQPHEFVPPDLSGSSTFMRSKSTSRGRTPSPPPFLGPAYTQSSPDIPIELAQSPVGARRRTFPDSTLHPFDVYVANRFD
ncbi:hypothetical protein BGW80DRAFT_911727 [Lactifluus volemus]|nr:hypothetical protein BGW80DRAFT_911727 [Lactifluus volemus]